MHRGASKPNIILVLIDTLRADRLSCCGYNRLTSPNIDRIAGEGLLFENAIVSAPWTLPSHASLFTGTYPYEHGATDQNLFLRNDIPTLAELLSEAGYYTVGHVSVNAWLSRETNLTRGFDQFYDATYRPAPVAGNRLIRKIRWKLRTTFMPEGMYPSSGSMSALEGYLSEYQRKKEPLFFFLHLMETHMPYRPVPSMMKKFGLDKADQEEIKYLQTEFRHYRAAPEKVSQQRLKILSDLYDACIGTVDKHLLRLFRLVRKREHRDNTVLVISSDHGEQLGEHGIINHWLSLYDVLLRVPIVIWAPGIVQRPGRISQQVQQHNLFHTLLDIAGYEGSSISKEIIKTKSFIENAVGTSPFPEYTFAQQAYAKMTLEHILKYNPDFHDERLAGPKRTVRSERYKFIEFAAGGDELYDIKSDPGETKNIIDKNPEIAAKLREQLENIRPIGLPSEIKMKKPQNFSSEVQKKLEDLGYL